MQIYEIITDDTLRETRLHGTIDFPFEYYYDDIKKFTNQLIEWHWHTEVEFVWVDAGPIDCLVGNERISLHTGEGMFINSGMLHRFKSDVQGILPNILFLPEFIAGKQTLIYKKYVEPILSSGVSYVVLKGGTNGWQDEILDLLKQIYATAKESGQMREFRVFSLVSTLWQTLFTALLDGDSLKESASVGNVLLQSRLHMMLEYVAEHYRERIMLEDIAAAANVSKSEALRCFHLGMQTTPVSYLIEYRLNRAGELLLTTGGTVTEIALTVGFESVGYFCRMFKKAFGRTPGGFRRDGEKGR